MLYKAKVNLTVGYPDRGTKEFHAGKFYKEADLGKPGEVDLSNFEIMSDTEAQREIASRPASKPMTNAEASRVAATPQTKGDIA